MLLGSWLQDPSSLKPRMTTFLLEQFLLFLSGDATSLGPPKPNPKLSAWGFFGARLQAAELQVFWGVGLFQGSFSCEDNAVPLGRNLAWNTFISVWTSSPLAGPELWILFSSFLLSFQTWLNFASVSRLLANALYVEVILFWVSLDFQLLLGFDLMVLCWLIRFLSWFFLMPSRR